MKSHRQNFGSSSKTRRGTSISTPQVETALRTSGIQEGCGLVNAMHISASRVHPTTTSGGLHADFENGSKRLAPKSRNGQYRTRYRRDNADAH